MVDSSSNSESERKKEETSSSDSDSDSSSSSSSSDSESSVPSEVSAQKPSKAEVELKTSHPKEEPLKASQTEVKRDTIVNVDSVEKHNDEGAMFKSPSVAVPPTKKVPLSQQPHDKYATKKEDDDDDESEEVDESKLTFREKIRKRLLSSGVMTSFCCCIFVLLGIIFLIIGAAHPLKGGYDFKGTCEITNSVLQHKEHKVTRAVWEVTIRAADDSVYATKVCALKGDDVVNGNPIQEKNAQKDLDKYPIASTQNCYYRKEMASFPIGVSEYNCALIDMSDKKIKEGKARRRDYTIAGAIVASIGVILFSIIFGATVKLIRERKAIRDEEKRLRKEKEAAIIEEEKKAREAAVASKSSGTKSNTNNAITEPK